MFALDSIIRKAVQTAITILVPGELFLTLGKYELPISLNVL